MPPSIPTSDVGARICDLKEWDSAATQDEIFSLKDLDEFVSTDLSSVFFYQQQKSEPRSIAELKRERSADSVLESQSKRRKLETGALYRFIPMVRDVFFLSLYCSKAKLSHALSLMCTPRLSVLRHLLLKEDHFRKLNPFSLPHI